MIRAIVLFFGIIFLQSCTKFSHEVSNLNGDEIQVLGHGGMGIHSGMPMNSLASIRSSIAEGSDGVELDVQMTSDGVLVAYHDAFLEESTCGYGRVHDWTWDRIDGLYYSDIHLFSNYPLMRLKDIFDAVENSSDYRYSFDCKLYTQTDSMDAYRSEFSSRVLEFIAQYGLYCSIESKDTSFLNLCKGNETGSALLYYPSTFEEGMDQVIKHGFDGLSISTHAISAQEVEEAHAQGLWVSLWNVRTRSRNKEAVLKNPDCIQTDRLKHLLDLLE